MTLMRSLRQIRMTLDWVEELKLEVKWHGRQPDEAANYCEECEVRNASFCCLFLQVSITLFVTDLALVVTDLV